MDLLEFECPWCKGVNSVTDLPDLQHEFCRVCGRKVLNVRAHAIVPRVSRPADMEQRTWGEGSGIRPAVFAGQTLRSTGEKTLIPGIADAMPPDIDAAPEYDAPPDSDSYKRPPDDADVTRVPMDGGPKSDPWVGTDRIQMESNEPIPGITGRSTLRLPPPDGAVPFTHNVQQPQPGAAYLGKAQTLPPEGYDDEAPAGFDDMEPPPEGDFDDPNAPTRFVPKPGRVAYVPPMAADEEAYDAEVMRSDEPVPLGSSDFRPMPSPDQPMELNSADFRAYRDQPDDSDPLDELEPATDPDLAHSTMTPPESDPLELRKLAAKEVSDNMTRKIKGQRANGHSTTRNRLQDSGAKRPSGPKPDTAVNALRAIAEQRQKVQDEPWRSIPLNEQEAQARELERMLKSSGRPKAAPAPEPPGAEGEIIEVPLDEDPAGNGEHDNGADSGGTRAYTRDELERIRELNEQIRAEYQPPTADDGIIEEEAELPQWEGSARDYQEPREPEAEYEQPQDDAPDYDAGEDGYEGGQNADDAAAEDAQGGWNNQDQPVAWGTADEAAQQEGYYGANGDAPESYEDEQGWQDGQQGHEPQQGEDEQGYADDAGQEYADDAAYDQPTEAYGEDGEDVAEDAAEDAEQPYEPPADENEWGEYAAEPGAMPVAEMPSKGKSGAGKDARAVARELLRESAPAPRPEKAKAKAKAKAEPRAARPRRPRQPVRWNRVFFNVFAGTIYTIMGLAAVAFVLAIVHQFFFQMFDLPRL